MARERVVMVDAGFEAVLGTVLLLGVAFGHIDNRDFPAPASDGVIALFGLALVLLGFALASLVRRELLGDRTLRLLIAVNAVFAVLIVLWMLIADGFSSAGRAVVIVTAACLLLLAAEEARVVRKPG